MNLNGDMIKEQPIKIRWPESTFVRTARKEHRCCGGYDHDKQERVKCTVVITRGERYIEYCGEVGAYQSGSHYHLDCARQQGLLLAPE